MTQTQNPQDTTGLKTLLNGAYYDVPMPIIEAWGLDRRKQMAKWVIRLMDDSRDDYSPDVPPPVDIAEYRLRPAALEPPINRTQGRRSEPGKHGLFPQ